MLAKRRGPSYREQLSHLINVREYTDVYVLEPCELAHQADSAGAGLSRRRRPCRRRENPRCDAAPGVCWRGPQPEGRAGRCGGRQCLPAARRRLRRELCRIRRRQDPRQLPRATANGGGADLWRGDASGEGRAHGWAVRQAALLRLRNPGQREAAQLPRRHHQRDGLRRGLTHARSAAHGAKLQPGVGDVEPAARLRSGRLCRSASGAPLEPGLCRAQPAVGALPGTGGSSVRDPGLHGRLRPDQRDHAANPRDLVLHQPRGAAAAVRAAADPRR